MAILNSKNFILILIFLAAVNGVIWGMLPEASEDLSGVRIAKVILEKGLFSDDFSLDMATDRIFHPILIAVVFKIFGHNENLVLILNLLIYIGLVLLIYKFCREFFNERLARLASFISAICYTLASYTGWFYREILFTGLIFLLIYLLYKAQFEKKNVWFIASGLVFGIATLTNGMLQFFIVLVIVNFLFLNRGRVKEIIPKLILFFISLVLIMSPWLISNYLNFGKTPFPFGARSGLMMSMRAEKVKAIEGKYLQHLVANTTGDYIAQKLFSDYDRREARLGYGNREDWAEMVFEEGQSIDEVDKELNKQAAIEMIKHPILSFQMATIDFLKFNTPMAPDIRMQHMFAEPGSHPNLPDFAKVGIILFIRFVYLIFAVFIVYAIIKHLRKWSQISWIILIVLYFNLFFSAVIGLARFSLPIYPFYIILFSLGLLTLLANRDRLLLLLSFCLAPFLCLRKKKTRDSRQLRILVIQTARIGDLVCSTPVFREIKKRYPKSFLSVLVIPLVKDVLANNLHLDEIILLDREKQPGIKGVFKLISQIRKKKFDWSFSLLPGMLNNLIPFWAGIPNRAGTTSKWSSKGVKISKIFNSRCLEYQRDTSALRHYLKLLGAIKINQVSEQKEIFVGPEQKKKAAIFLEKNHLGKEDVLVGITVTAGKKIKEWAPEKFSELADRIIEELGAKVIFIGSKNDEAAIEKIQSLMNNQTLKATEFNLIELAGLLERLSLFISVDTGPLYMADALGIPVIDIVGPHDVKSQSPSGNFIIVQKMPPCGPCSFISSAPSYCREGHLKCIRDIKVEDVFHYVPKMLNLRK